MFIYNIKFNKTKAFKIFFIIISIVVLLLFIFALYKIINKANLSYANSDQFSKSNIKNISNQNYTNILKASHENIDEYVGNRIHFIGYVYRLYDFTENQFVLARDMIISSDKQFVIVGFLSEYKDAKKFSDGTWVEVTGKITKGDYNGEIPIVKVEEMKEIQKPTDEYVYPPDERYIPTSTIF